MTAAAHAGVRIRSAEPNDNAALVRLAAACPVRAGVSFCTHRHPDFFALSRLQGEAWDVIVAEGAEAGVVGCACLSERHVWLNGVATRVMHLGDFKVHPAFRARGIGDRLLHEVRDRCAAVHPDVPVLVTALAGNRAIERRVPGPRGLPVLTPVGTVRVYTLLGRRASRPPDGGRYHVRRAAPADLDVIAAFWTRTAPARHGAPVLGRDDLARWAARVPGLSLADYLLAFDRGRLAGLLGVWDPRTVKETRVMSYGRGVALARGVYNAAAWVIGVPPLPGPGGTLRAVHALHCCVSPREPGALRALLAVAQHAAHQRRVPVFALGLDARDPAAGAVRWLPRVAADVRWYLTSPCGRYAGPPLDARPLYFETALV
jgi:GNAT superfamily N-acetyltransferase